MYSLANIWESTEKKEGAAGWCLRNRTLFCSEGISEGMQGTTEARWGGRRLAVSLTDKPDTLQVTPSVRKQCGWASFPDVPEQLCVGCIALPPSFLKAHVSAT